MGAGNNYDVIVVGGGPAGSSAAYELARSGVRVALLEKHFMPRYKTCGGGLVGRAMKLLPYDVSGVVERSCNGAELHLLDADLHFSVLTKEPLVHLVMRDRFDEALFSHAREAGARCMEGVTVGNLLRHPSSIEVVTDRRSFHAPFVIGADGALSTVARRAGWEDRESAIPLVEWEISPAEGCGQALPTLPRFDIGTVPLGYAWIFPKKSHLSVGLGSMELRGPRLREVLGAYVGRYVGRGGVLLRQSAHVLLRQARKGGPAKDGVLLVGDAAGLADPVAWEGISSAILSGRIAAQTIAGEGLNRKAVEERYPLELASQIGQDLRWGRLLSVFLYQYPAMRTRFFRRHGKRFTETMADIFTGRKRYSEIFSRTSIYNRLLNLSTR